MIESMQHFTGERRAFAAASLALYTLLYTLVYFSPPAGWETAFGALAGVYGLGFFSVVAGYFWARWYAIGLGLSGVISACIGMFQIGAFEPVLLFYGGTHGIISVCLWGKAVASHFDGRKEWRQRFHLDEETTRKLGKTVTRASVSLPYVILYALAPKEGAMLGGLVVATCVAAGMWGLLSRFRTWSILLLTTAGFALGGISVFAGDICSAAVVGATALTGCLLPFGSAVFRYIKR